MCSNSERNDHYIYDTQFSAISKLSFIGCCVHIKQSIMKTNNPLPDLRFFFASFLNEKIVKIM